jgi:hypothetical protein
MYTIDISIVLKVYMLNDTGVSCVNSFCGDSYRTDENRNNTLHSTLLNETRPDIDADNLNINRNIYRYKFSDEFTKELYRFSKIHQYDHRTDFKEAWSCWIEIEDEIVNQEIIRLHNLGYIGNVLDKMFKSARYYFRKKSSEKKEPVKRREYIGVQKDLLDAMDEHLKININMDDYKPSDGFTLFCKDNIDILKAEVKRFCVLGYKNPIEIKNKIKKTYKNRYFMLVSK